MFSFILLVKLLSITFATNLTILAVIPSGPVAFFMCSSKIILFISLTFAFSKLKKFPSKPPKLSFVVIILGYVLYFSIIDEKLMNLSLLI